MKKLYLLIPLLLFCLLPLKTSADYVTIEEQIALEDEMYELEMLAIAVHAEAGNQSFEGRQAVAGVILNRMDSTRFPNTISEVLHQKNQFSCMTDGAYEKACWEVEQTDYDAVAAELYERRYRDALFFRTGHYHEGRTPLYRIGAHYFSK